MLYEYRFLAMEHWDNAVFGAEVAAHNMVNLEPLYRPHLLLPGFWAGQFGVNIKSVGVPPFADEIVFTQGSVKERHFAAAYGRRGRIVAAVTFDHGKWLERELDLERRDNQHLGFSQGIHFCFGAPLARLEVQVAVGEFVRRVENPRLVEDPPPYRHNQIFRGPRHVLVDIDGIRDSTSVRKGSPCRLFNSSDGSNRPSCARCRCPSPGRGRSW
ncbi:cytochrome P450 [Streptomyces lydicus]|uniref:cytochrome P450 n=1 Tax=Streptomyces lydicus TaxID=47763 RepID=UPI00371D3591